MFELKKSSSSNKVALYESLAKQAQALFEGESDMVANAANLSALLFNSLENVNWAGFYFYKNNELVLGPFQGMPACIRIAIGKGVCGTAAETKKTQVVKNVNDFHGHIACDAATQSEIVIPLIYKGQLLGVLDIDSPSKARFTDADRFGLEKLAKHYIASLGN
jgi:GAF domain-containing protein